MVDEKLEIWYDRLECAGSIKDIEELITNHKRVKREEGIVTSRVTVTARHSKAIRLDFFRALTQSDKDQKEREEAIKRKKWEEDAEAYRKKMSEAAKKGWINRKIELVARKERDRLAKEKADARKLAEKEARAIKREEDRKAQEFLKKLLEEEQ